MGRDWRDNNKSLIIIVFITAFIITGLVFLYFDAAEMKTDSHSPDVLFPERDILSQVPGHNPLGIDTILFLHTNDRHFDLNNMEYLVYVVDSLRARYHDVFLFDAGDIFVRHPNRWIVNGTPKPDYSWYGQRTLEMVTSMNDMGYDALTPGNHELAYIHPFTRNALDVAKFPLLAANIGITTEHLPPVRDYILLESQFGHKVAVLGLSVDNAGFLGIRQRDIFQTAEEYMFLRDSVHIFVALTHIGLNNDKRLASQFPLFDVIIGGHSHDMLKQPLLINNVLIAHAGGNPHEVSDLHPVFLGKVFVRLENGRITHKWGEVIEINNK
jgi:2',3'-cyclic-nucleotide 2'-phosphodiesterase (5'-nucleotidase family)